MAFSRRHERDAVTLAEGRPTPAGPTAPAAGSPEVWNLRATRSDPAGAAWAPTVPGSDRPAEAPDVVPPPSPRFSVASGLSSLARMRVGLLHLPGLPLAPRSPRRDVGRAGR